MKQLFALCTLALVGCSDITSPTSVAPSVLVPTAPAFATLVNEKTAFTNAVVNACNGETVVVSGERHFVVKATSGGFSVSEDSHFSGFGATTGVKYEGSLKSADKEMTKKDGTFSTSNSVTIHLVAKGKDVPDLLFGYSIRYTINPDGTLSHEDYDTTFRCK